MIWGGVTGVIALAHFFAATVYEGGEGAVVYGMGFVDSGRFGILKVWGRKGVRFGVEGGINSYQIISSSITF